MAAPRILIVGAGIAGLSLARALAQRGLTADVVERSTEHRTTGAGLYLPANAVRVLDRLGLGAELAARARPVTRQHLLDQRGRALARFPVSAIWGDVGACYAISRSAVQEMLLAAVDSSWVRLGLGVAKADTDGTVTFADGTQEEYDLVVGADGVGSAVRASVFPGSEPRFLNQVCWRFLAQDSTGLVADGVWTAQLGSGGRGFLTLPLGDGQVYCYADLPSAEPAEPATDWRGRFADFTGPVPALLEQGADAYFAPLQEIDDTTWATSRVILIGDAAHACSPSMAQGGAMALEDSLVLAELLADGAALPAAYNERRTERIRWVLEQNHRRDKARDLPAGLRNLMLRLAGERLYKANHSKLLPRP